MAERNQYTNGLQIKAKTEELITNINEHIDPSLYMQKKSNSITVTPSSSTASKNICTRYYYQQTQQLHTRLATTHILSPLRFVGQKRVQIQYMKKEILPLKPRNDKV